MIIPAIREWNDPIDEGVFDLQTHLLHGLIHCNGLGHLICINGIEGGSNFGIRLNLITGKISVEKHDDLF